MTDSARMSLIELDDVPAFVPAPLVSGENAHNAQYSAPVAAAIVASVATVAAPVNASIVVHTKEANGSAIGSEGALSARASGTVSSARELAIASDLNWDPILAPIVTAEGVAVDETLARAVIRSDTRKAIGVVGAKYAARPHLPLFDLADAIAGAGAGLRLANAGHKGGGARPFVQLSMTTDSPAGACERFISLFTSHDGSLCEVAGFSATMIVCRNTYAHALGDAVSGIKIRHTVNAISTAEIIGRIAQASGDHALAFDNAALRMMGQPFSDSNMVALASHLYPGEGKRAENTRGELIKAWTDAPGAMPGTAWGAAQAVTFHTSHNIGKPESREETHLFGSGTGADVQAAAWWLLDVEAPVMAARLQTVKLFRV